MKLAFVQDWLTGFAGGEQVLLALHQLYPEAPIYTSLYNPEKAPQFAQATVIPSYLQRVPGLLKRDKLAIPLMPAAFESFDLKGFDTIVSVGAGFSKGVITHPGQRHIAYLHTPIRYAWRLGGDTRNAGLWDSWLRERAMHRLRMWDVISAVRPDEFIGNSTTVVRRIEKIYRREAIAVAPPVNVSAFTVQDQHDGYYLTVGRLVGYKRTDLIIDACLKSKRKLMVVGTGPELERYRARAAAAPWIQFPGRVSDSALRELYARARAFIFAAEEDAGIVPVEAMACGKPVIAYGVGGVTDVVRDGVDGVLYAEQSDVSLLEALEKFEGSTFSAPAIRSQAEHFSTELFSKKMRAIIEADKQG
jgi:glycosyltransferase involved in cell wall biosynthesis